MNKKQLLLVTCIASLVIGLYFFAKNKPTVPKQKEFTAKDATENNSLITSDTILKLALQKLKPEQRVALDALAIAMPNTDISKQKEIYKKQISFWKDSVKIYEPYAIYTAKLAKLENSEKSLTFAAQLFVDNLLTEPDPSKANWMASEAKTLLTSACKLNPDNDSTKIGLAACDMLGNTSQNPMQAILEAKTIVDKHPDNVYGHLVLGLGGKKTGQWDKAIEHFSTILKLQPHFLPVMFELGDCYEKKGDNVKAKQWFKKAMELEPDVNVKKQIEEHINELK